MSQSGGFASVGVHHQSFNLDEEGPDAMVLAAQGAEHCVAERLLELKISLFKQKIIIIMVHQMLK